MAACCPPAPCPERGRWLPARPAGFRPTRGSCAAPESRRTGYWVPPGPFPSPSCVLFPSPLSPSSLSPQAPPPAPLPADPPPSFHRPLLLLPVFSVFLFPFSFTLFPFTRSCPSPSSSGLPAKPLLAPLCLHLLVACPHTGHQRELALNRTGLSPHQNLGHLQLLCRGHRVRPAPWPGLGGTAVWIHPLRSPPRF